jgi:hypothetical protein
VPTTNGCYAIEAMALNRDELISKMQFFAFALRHRRWDQVLATLALALFAFGLYLKEAWKQLAPAVYLAYAAFALGVVFVVCSPSHPPVGEACPGSLPPAT